MKSFIKIFILLISLNAALAQAQVSPVWQVSFNDSLPEDNFAVKSKIDNEDNIVILAHGSNSSLGTEVDFI